MNKKSNSLITPLKIFRLSHVEKQKKSNDKKEKESLGRELNPRPLPIGGKVMVGPLPYQGNALPG
jgi:CRISPR/Cas system CMR subunit Cmr4 (Cas7 group RAMP superfamily)